VLWRYRIVLIRCTHCHPVLCTSTDANSVPNFENDWCATADLMNQSLFIRLLRFLNQSCAHTFYLGADLPAFGACGL
ncbi:MAG: hypothetical protein EBS61_03855, partial [Betaproteobacteria bacterium]|nr:hypothetical protein [Betaproteobacteria bacterium]